MAEMIDCICCEAAIDELYKLPCKIDEDGYRWVLSRDVAHMIDSIPDADVVARDCYDRILAENDTMREQLAQIGKKPGDTMDDVRPVVKAHWIYHQDDYGDYYECSHCHDEYVVYEGDMCWKFCPTCGAEMKPDKTDREEQSNGGG